MRCSTPKISTNRVPSSHKGQSTTFSLGATSQGRSQRTFKIFGQTSHARRFTPTHRAPRVGAQWWSRLTRQSSAGWWASQEVLEMIPLKELKAVRHGLYQNLDDIRGRTVKLYPDNMVVVDVLRKMSSRCPGLMAEIKELVPWLLEHKIRLEVVYIRSEANFADAPSPQRGLDMWSLHLPTQQELLRLVESTLGSQVCTDPFACRQSTVDPRFDTPLHCRHSAVFNGLLLDWSQPVTLWLNPPWHLLPQVLEKSFERQEKRYPGLPLLAPPAMVSRSAAAFLLPLQTVTSTSLCQIAPPRPRRALRQSRGVSRSSGLRLCVEDDLLQAGVLPATQGDNSWIRWSLSQECQHVLSSDIRPYNKKLLVTSPALQQEVAFTSQHHASLNFLIGAG